jgi:uncharacterized protein involved in exopolysaccharide biosynthesis
VYTATASFIPQGNESTRGGLASLADQFGFSLSTGGQATSPEFYARLVRSRVLIGKIVHDTFVVAEMENRRVPFLDLFEIKGKTAKIREDEGVKELTDAVGSAAAKLTGVVDVSVQTPWPSVSVAIANELVDGVNQFNLRTRQGQAAAERKFVETRLALASSDLRAAEDRLEGFLRDNRQFAGSPQLTFQRDRLQRNVALLQQVFTGLTQSYEEVRIREVRDTPVITVVEAPTLPTRAEPRRRLLTTLLGGMVGALIGALLAYNDERMRRRQEEGDPEVDIFLATLRDATRDVLGRFRRSRKPASQPKV